MSTGVVPLRERKRRSAMRTVQRVAVRRFHVEGFDRVPVESIAEDAEVSPVSVYRWFGSKEGIVLWDEYDPPMLAAIAEELDRHAPLPAVRRALTRLLDEVYAEERDLVLDRTRLILSVPSLRAAAALQSRGFAVAIREVLVGSGTAPLEATVAAEVAVALLGAAVEAWADDAARTPLAEWIGVVFDAHATVVTR